MTRIKDLHLGKLQKLHCGLLCPRGIIFIYLCFNALNCIPSEMDIVIYNDIYLTKPTLYRVTRS